MKQGTLENLRELNTELKGKRIPALLVGGMSRALNGAADLPRKDIDILLMTETDEEIEGIDVWRLHRFNGRLRLPEESVDGKPSNEWFFWKNKQDTLYNWTFPNWKELKWSEGITTPDRIFLARMRAKLAPQTGLQHQPLMPDFNENWSPSVIAKRIRLFASRATQESHCLDDLQIRVWSNYGRYCLMHHDYLLKNP